MSNYGFPSRLKLLKTDDFSSVFSFRKRVFGHRLAFLIKPNGHNHARLGIVVSKKVVRRSVDRNYIRRVLRECFRLNLEKFQAIDLVVRVQKPFTRSDFQQTNQEFLELINRISRMAVKLPNQEGTGQHGPMADLAD